MPRVNPFFLKRALILFFLSATLFFVGNSFFSLSDPDEVFYSLSAREMNQRNEWLTAYIFNQPQFEKPILTYWCIKIAFYMFGENPFAARFFPALFACFGVLAVYALGLLGFANERRAFLGALVLGTSAFYLAMGKTVFTDMIFTVFILYSLLSFYWAYSRPIYKRHGILAFYVFAALAVLTKGPLGLLIPEAIVVTFLLYRRELAFLKTSWFAIGFGLCLVIAVPWYWYEFSLYGNVFIQEFFYNDHWRRLLEAEHKGNDHWYFYPLSMIAGVFPWSLFLLAAFTDLFKRLKFSVKPFEYFLLSWILIVFIIFQVSHSKLVSYILPMFPALALLAANYIDERLQEDRQEILKKLCYVVTAFLILLGIGVVGGHKFYQMYVPLVTPMIWLSAAWFAFCGIAVTLLLKDKVRQAIIFLSFSLVPFILTCFMIVSFLEPHISMHEASYYVPTASIRKTTILTIKPYARGISYYTNQNVVAMTINGQNYWSPHSIPILNTKEKLEDFLKTQGETFAIVRGGGYRYLKENFAHQFRIDVLKVSGLDYVLKLEPLKVS